MIFNLHNTEIACYLFLARPFYIISNCAQIFQTKIQPTGRIFCFYNPLVDWVRKIMSGIQHFEFKFLPNCEIVAELKFGNNVESFNALLPIEFFIKYTQ